MLLEECPRQVDAVRKAVEARDSAALDRAAHKLKGSLGSLAAGEAMQLAESLEKMGKENRLEGAQHSWGLLEAAMERLNPELIRLTMGSRADIVM